MKTVLLIASALVFLTGCGNSVSQEKPREVVRVVTKHVSPVAPILPKVDTLTTKPVIWKVLNTDGNTWFALDSEGYRNLSWNTAAGRILIRQQQSVIRAYERSYEK